MEIDTLGSAIVKYVCIAVIAGSIGFYKGCDIGREMVVKADYDNCANQGYSIMYKIEDDNMVPYHIDMSKAKKIDEELEKKLKW